MRAQIIVVSGLPGSGKSTVAAWLAHRYSRPLLAKDAFKEALFDTLSTGDAAWSRRLSQASYATLFAMANELARTGMPCIVEGNFRWEQTSAYFERLGSFAEFKQVWCWAPTDLLVERLQQRASDSARHPGHRDADFVPRLLAEAGTVVNEPLPLAGPLLKLDTSLARSDLETVLVRFLEGS